MKPVQFLRGGIDGPREIDRERDDVLGAEPGIDGAQAEETLQHQPSPGQQDQRERDLSDDQRGAQPFLAGDRRSAARQKRSGNAGPRDAKSRREAEDDPGQERQGQRERQDLTVDLDQLGPGDPSLGRESQQGGHAPARQEDAAQAACQRHESALGEQLPDEPRAAGAERRAHRDLALPAGRAGQQQIRDVGAGDQQHEPDGARKDRQRPPDVPHHELLERDHAADPLRVGFRVGALSHDRVELGLRLRDGDARLQPADHRVHE